MKRRIGVLTSGGDCPGLNAVLRGVALSAEKLNFEVLGFRDGFEGLLPPAVTSWQKLERVNEPKRPLKSSRKRRKFCAKIGSKRSSLSAATVP